MPEIEKKGFSIPEKVLHVTASVAEYNFIENLKSRLLYLYGEIAEVGEGEGILSFSSKTGELIERIIAFNREDHGKEVAERRPIYLFINSPGGSMNEGFALVDAISLSKTPIYTVNIGEWSSMSFLIGITGHKRLSFPNATFLLHDGSSGAYGSTNKVQDRVKFEERYEAEVVKEHVLKHSNMTSTVYDALARVEYYMLPGDAMKHGFIDEIITDIDAIF